MSSAKEFVYSQRPTTLILSHIPSGTRLRLRENAYRQLRQREWIFNRTENNSIFLMHEGGAYGLVVEIQDIDWNEFQVNPAKN